MVPRKPDYGLKRGGGTRSGAVLNFRSAANLRSVRRSSAVLPSVLTFLVIVASGGLLLMIEKGMLNSMEPPPPRGSGRRLELAGEAAKHGRAAAVDVDSQVGLCRTSTVFCNRVENIDAVCHNITTPEHVRTKVHC